MAAAASSLPGPAEPLDLETLRADPLGFILESTRRYGDIFGYRTAAFRGAPPLQVVFLNHPAYVKHVLQDRHQNYGKEGTPDFMMLRPMLGEGLMTSEGEDWLRQRRLLQPAFHRERIEELGRVMTEEAEALAACWAPAVAAGQSLEIEEEMTRLTLNVLARTLFGFDMRQEQANFSQAVQEMNRFTSHFDPGDRAALQRFVAAQQAIRALVQKVIDARRSRPGEASDLLSMLLHARDEATGHALSDRQLQDQVFTFIMAGHETTSKGLTWSLYCLDRYPAVEQELRAEIAATVGDRVPTVADLARMPYTWMVLQEVLRILPPVWSVSRRARENDEIGGFEIPAGTLVVVSPYALHRHPRYWPEPERFWPERFADDAADALPPFAYFPFSGGPRLCIGRPFAIMELRLVLPTILQRYRLRTVLTHPVEPEALVTLRPRHGMLMTAEPVAGSTGPRTP